MPTKQSRPAARRLLRRCAARNDGLLTPCHCEEAFFADEAISLIGARRLLRRCAARNDGLLTPCHCEERFLRRSNLILWRGDCFAAARLAMTDYSPPVIARRRSLPTKQSRPAARRLLRRCAARNDGLLTPCHCEEALFADEAISFIGARRLLRRCAARNDRMVQRI